jgi:hypothetical protein
MRQECVNFVLRLTLSRSLPSHGSSSAPLWRRRLVGQFPAGSCHPIERELDADCGPVPVFTDLAALTVLNGLAHPAEDRISF